MKVSKDLKTFNLLLRILFAIVELEKEYNPDKLVALSPEISRHIEENYGLDSIIENVINIENELTTLKGNNK